jgi:hypothetical protein
LALLIPTAASGARARTEIIAADDWPADAFLEMGRMFCSGGDVVWIDPVTPTCPQSGQLHLRGARGYGCVQAQTTEDGMPEPRMTGVAEWVVNGNLDEEHTGPVWGTWRILPGECDPARLDEPSQSFWKGVWQGQRVKFCDDFGCRWIGQLEVVGKGIGGLDGLHLKGTETITTFTPLPLPWELIGLCPPCGPEEVLIGTIKE